MVLVLCNLWIFQYRICVFSIASKFPKLMGFPYMEFSIIHTNDNLVQITLIVVTHPHIV